MLWAPSALVGVRARARVRVSDLLRAPSARGLVRVRVRVRVRFRVRVWPLVGLTNTMLLG